MDFLAFLDGSRLLDFLASLERSGFVDILGILDMSKHFFFAFFNRS